MTTETILTDEQIEHGRHDTFSTNNPFCPCDSKTMRKAARWAEQAVLQSPEIRALREDAERYRWLKENIMEQYNLPGSYYLPDDAPEVWDRTIDAAKEQT